MFSQDALEIIGTCVLIALVLSKVIQYLGLLLVHHTKFYRLIVIYCTLILPFSPTYAYGNRGWMYYVLRKYDKAMKDCNRAIELDARNYYVYNNRGLLYQKMKQYEQAFEDFDTATKLRPDFYKPYVNRSSIYFSCRDYKKTLEETNRYIVLEGITQHASLYMMRGVAYSLLDQYKLAMQDFDYAIKLEPKYSASYYNKGCLYFRMNDLKSGYISIVQAILLEPKHIMYNWTSEWCKMYVEQPNDATMMNTSRRLRKKLRKSCGNCEPQFKLSLPMLRSVSVIACLSTITKDDWCISGYGRNTLASTFRHHFRGTCKRTRGL